jgi:hypothetical protein
VNVQDAPIPTFPRRTGEGELAEAVFERAERARALIPLTSSPQPLTYTDVGNADLVGNIDRPAHSQPTRCARRLYG